MGIILMLLLLWGGLQVWHWIFPDQSSITPYSSNRSGRECVEPENPYNYGTGHYAGFEYGEQGNYCSGNSDSFIEGCEEYNNQEEAYNNCMDN